MAKYTTIDRDLAIATTTEKLTVRFLAEPDLQKQMPIAVAELSALLGQVFDGKAAGCQEVIVLSQAAALRLTLPRDDAIASPDWTNFVSFLLSDLVDDVTTILTLLGD